MSDQPALDRTSPDPAVAADSDLARSPWLRRVILLVIVVFIAVAAAYGSRLGTDPAIVDSPLLGQPVPDVTLPYLEQDGSLRLGDLEGDIVVVNFWASWCTACREEHDDLLLAAERFADQGVTFVGIVFQDRPEAAVGMLDEMGRGYANLTDPGSRAAIDFGVFGVPETFFIDREGTVVAKVVGRSDLTLLRQTIETMLAGRTPDSVNRAGFQPQPVELGGR